MTRSVNAYMAMCEGVMSAMNERINIGPSLNHTHKFRPFLSMDQNQNQILPRWTWYWLFFQKKSMPRVY